MTYAVVAVNIDDERDYEILGWFNKLHFAYRFYLEYKDFAGENYELKIVEYEKHFD
jgi:hypothetical protein